RRGTIAGARLAVDRFARGLQHRAAARRVHVHHPDAQACRRRNGACDGVWDVVKFQIEEDTIAAPDELFDDRRSLAGEQAAANLECARHAAQPIDECTGFARRVHVERDYEAIHSESFARTSTVPTRSRIRSIRWRVM